MGKGDHMGKIFHPTNRINYATKKINNEMFRNLIYGKFLVIHGRVTMDYLLNTDLDNTDVIVLRNGCVFNDNYDPKDINISFHVGYRWVELQNIKRLLKDCTLHLHNINAWRQGQELLEKEFKYRKEICKK